ncbi:MAG: hypothetical protein ACREVE_12930 [Gammaproteobacteria bacterium]
MRTRSLLALVCAALVAGCGGDGDPDSGNAFTDIFTRDANSQPVEYGDPAPLESDMEALFGAPNSEPRRPRDVL